MTEEELQWIEDEIGDCTGYTGENLELKYEHVRALIAEVRRQREELLQWSTKAFHEAEGIRRLPSKFRVIETPTEDAEPSSPKP
jgi:hypothetical protein